MFCFFAKLVFKKLWPNWSSNYLIFRADQFLHKSSNFRKRAWEFAKKLFISIQNSSCINWILIQNTDILSSRPPLGWNPFIFVAKLLENHWNPIRFWSPGQQWSGIVQFSYWIWIKNKYDSAIYFPSNPHLFCIALGGFFRQLFQICITCVRIWLSKVVT